MTASSQVEWNISDAFWRWALLAMIPMVLAAGAREKFEPNLVLPDEQSYRTPLSDSILESLDWRTPTQLKPDWRQPRSSATGWRTESTHQSEPFLSRKKIDLFPRYQPGNPTDFDHINRDEKPQIKVFEFGP